MQAASPFRLPRKTPFGIGENVTEWATGLSKLDKFYAHRPVGCDTKSFLRFTLDILGIDYQIVKGELNHIPQHGPTVIVANHPLGCIEGVILAELLLMLRDDVQILANQHLKILPELDELFIGVDVFATQSNNKANLKALRLAHQHLAKGGLLLLFPAGEVSQMVDGKKRRIEDKEWSRSVSSLIKRSKATTVPVFIEGQNSKPFYMAGKIHPILRTLMLGRELLNKHQQPIRLAIGSPIHFKEIHKLNDPQMVNYLRLNTYLMQRRIDDLTAQSPSTQELQPIAPQLAVEDIEFDIHHLPPERHLLTSGEFDVYCAGAEHIPSLLHEIGRLRELNFRAVGEGTGFALDLDEYDQHYLHLFVWDRKNQALVGSYRLGLVDELMKRRGLSGLYSRTLFDYDQRFIGQLGHAIELGRSVIGADYQKSMNALLLLWKGIGTFISRHPEYTHLFGPVSISNDYSQKTRQLLTEAMTLHHYDRESAQYVKPSNPLPKEHLGWNANMLSALGDLQLLSRVISRIDEGKGVPVLLRQYLAMNGKLVCFNVDPAFNNALDGLIVVDLREVEEKTLGRYMGTTQAKAFLQQHN